MLRRTLFLVFARLRSRLRFGLGCLGGSNVQKLGFHVLSRPLRAY